MKSEDLFKFEPSLNLIQGSLEGLLLEGISVVESPTSNCLHFIKNKKFADLFFKAIKDSNKSLKNCVLIVDEKFYHAHNLSNYDFSSFTTFSSKNVPLTLAKLSRYFYDLAMKDLDFFSDSRNDSSTRIDPSAQIAADVFIGKNVSIGKNCKVYPGVKILGNVQLESDITIYPNVVIYPNVKIGESTRVHASTSIGTDGFGYVFDNGRHVKIWHYGGVVIGKNVEIGSNSAIDGGTFRPTIIEDFCIIDNQVQIAHNTHLKKGVIMCGQSGTAGSTQIGEFSVLGGKAGVANDLIIGKACQIAAGSIVNASWKDGSKIGGYPARLITQWLRSQAYLNNIIKGKKNVDE